MGCACSDCTRLSQCPKPYPISSPDDSGDSRPEVIITSTGNKSTTLSKSNDIDKRIPHVLSSNKINEQMIGNSPGKEKNLVRTKSKDSDNWEKRALSMQRDILFEEILIEKETAVQNQVLTSELTESSFSVNVESEPNSQDLDYRHERISGSKVVEQKKSLEQGNNVKRKKWISGIEKRRLYSPSKHQRRQISDMKTESLAIVVHDSKDNMVKVVVDTRGQQSAMSTVNEKVVPWTKGSPRLSTDYRTKTTDLIATGTSPEVRSSPRDSELQSMTKQIGDAAARNRENTAVIRELTAENLRYKIRNQVRGSKRKKKRSYQDERGSYRKIRLRNTSSTRHIKSIGLGRARNTASDPLNSRSSVDVTPHESVPGVAIRANRDDINKQVFDHSSVDKQDSDASVEELKVERMRSQIRTRARSSKVRSPRTRHVHLSDVSLALQVKITNMRKVGSLPSKPINSVNHVDSPSSQSSSEVVNIASSVDIVKQDLDKPLTFSSSFSKQKTDASPKAASVEEQSSVNSGQWEFSELMII